MRLCRECLLIIAALLASLCLPLPSQAQKNTLAIFSFRPTNFEAMGDSGDILLSILSEIEEGKSIELMPRREMEEILTQRGIPQTDNTSMVLDAGKVLGVDFVLFGQVTRDAGRVSCKAFLMDIQSGTIAQSWLENFSGNKGILTRIPSFVSELADAMTRSPIPQPKQEPVMPDRPLAIEHLKAETAGDAAMLSWEYDPALPIEGFNVYRSKTAGGPFEGIGKTSEGSYRDETLEEGQVYYYRIGVLGSGKETQSNTVTVSVKASGQRRPYPPIVMKGRAYVRRIQIDFIPSLLNKQNNFEIKKYVLYRRTDPDSEWARVGAMTAQREYQSGLHFEAVDRKRLRDGRTYTYAVSSLDAHGQESPLSDPISLSTIGPPVLASAESDEPRTLRLVWNPVENVDGYILYRRVDRGKWKKIGPITDSATAGYTDEDGLRDGQEYRYYLTTYDTHGETGPSNTVTITTTAAPTHPGNLLVKSGMFRSAMIMWDPAEKPGIGGYNIYRGSKKSRVKIIARVEGHQSQSHIDRGTDREPLKDGTDYYYSVSSYSRHGTEGKSSPPALARTKPRPTDVKGFSAVSEGTSIYLGWERNPEPDIKGYVIFRARNSRKPARLREFSADQFSYRDDDIRPEDSYTYGIIAEDTDGLRSDPAESRPVLSKVEAVLAIEKDGMLRRVDLSWQPLKNVDGYSVYRRSAEGPWQRIARIRGATTTRYTDKKDLLDGKLYRYHLTSYDSEGETEPSNEVSAKTKALPSPPAQARAKSGLVKAVEISWDPIQDPDIGGYSIHRGSEEGKLEPLIKVKGHRSGSYTDKGTFFQALEDGKHYFYSVASYNVFGSEGESCPVVKAYTKPRPTAVSGFSVSTEGNRIVMKWSRNPEPDIKAYVLYRRRGRGPWSTIAERDGDQTSFVDSDLKPEAIYSYRIVAEDAAGLEGEPLDSEAVPSPLVQAAE